MKKVTAMVMAFLLVVSAFPLVLAEEDTTSIDVEVSTDVAVDSDDDATLSAEAKLKAEQHKQKQEEYKKRKAALHEQYKQQKAQLKDAIVIKKDVIMKDLNKVYKEDRAEARENYKAEREAWHDYKQRLKDCSGDVCAELEAQMGQHMQPMLLRTADAILEMLRSLQARVEANDFADESRLLADLQARIDAVVAARARAEALGPDATPEELKEAAKVIRSEWSMTKQAVVSTKAHFYAQGMGKALERIEQLRVKMTRILASFEEQGYDMTDAQGRYDAFVSHINKAVELHAQAEVTFKAARESNDPQQIREAHRLYHDAHLEIKAAHGALKGFVTAVKATNKGVTVLATS